MYKTNKNLLSTYWVCFKWDYSTASSSPPGSPCLPGMALNPAGSLSLPSYWLPLPTLGRIPLPMEETRVRSLAQEDSLEKEMAIHSSILA